MAKKQRLDILMLEKKLVKSREKAKALIMAGKVLVDGELETKAGSSFFEDSKIEIKTNPNPYISRGGLKLEKALDYFSIDLKDRVCLDGGASTGGFTDCMLQNDAKLVYAVDVGYGQLDWTLRNDNRVIVFEKTNLRYMDKNDIEDDVTFASLDLSFISITKILKNLIKLLAENFEMVCLIKPQFEAGRENVKKGGVVKDKNIHIEVIKQIINYARSIDLAIINLTYSPIKGPNGNIEYLIHLSSNSELDNKEIDCIELVNNAHLELN